MRFSELFSKRLWTRRESAVLLILIAIVPGLFHIYWPLLIIVLIALIVFMPVPRLLDSLLGRTFSALLVFYALQQLPALLQLFVLTHSGFVTTDVLTGIFAVCLLLLFGTSRAQTFKLIRMVDLMVLAMCVLFVLCFLPIVLHPGAATRLVTTAGEQVVDSATHWQILTRITVSQNLSRIYGSDLTLFYPSGFHFTTAFIEDAFSLAGGEHSWLTNVKIYFAQYILFGCVLMVGILYFSYGLLERICAKQKPKLWMYGAVTASAGISSLILFLLMFFFEGFLNFYYVCATILAGMCFLLEDDRFWSGIFGRNSERLVRILPVGMFLLFGLGVSMSWPLLTPPILLTALMYFKFPPIRNWAKSFGRYWLYLLPIVVVVVAHAAAIYAQVKFLPSSFSHVNIPGALQNFNVILILVGFVLVAAVIFTNLAKSSKLFTILFAPYILLVAALMLYQYFTLGQATYYLIKAVIPFQIFSVVLLSVTAVVLTERGTDLSLPVRFSFPILIVVSIIIATVGTVSQPLIEVRGIFRDASGLGKPPYIESDAAIITRLGEHDKIGASNLTILHYNPQNGYYFAQSETATWADAMSTQEADALAGKTDNAGMACFTKQYNLLDYGVPGAAEQQQLANAVNSCIRVYQAKNEPYYIVSDVGSVAKLREQFGSYAQIVTQ